MKATNYLKLSVRSAVSLHDFESVNIKPRLPRETVATWVWPFKSRAEGLAALKAAQDKRAELREARPEMGADAFQLATWLPSGLRGVGLVGRPRLAAFVEEAAVA